MRSFGLVENKLEEADFFLTALESAGADLFSGKFFFSAFVSAARSVTFAMQASLKDADGFADWYSIQQTKIRGDKLAQFFHECRTDSQHIGINPIEGVSSSDFEGKFLLWFGQPEPGRYKYMPNTDVVTACGNYLSTVCALVDQCYIDFGFLIDPDQIYTPNGLRVLGKTIEDIEIEIGFPAGWTDIPWAGGLKTEHRLEMLRREIPGSTIKPLLVKYLKRELEYPCEPFTVQNNT